MLTPEERAEVRKRKAEIEEQMQLLGNAFRSLHSQEIGATPFAPATDPPAPPAADPPVSDPPAKEPASAAPASPETTPASAAPTSTPPEVKPASTAPTIVPAPAPTSTATTAPAPAAPIVLPTPPTGPIVTRPENAAELRERLAREKREADRAQAQLVADFIASGAQVELDWDNPLQGKSTQEIVDAIQRRGVKAPEVK